MGEEVDRVGRGHAVKHGLHRPPQSLPSPQRHTPQQLLDLAECRFDGRVVRRVRRQEDQLRPARFDQRSHPRRFVTRQVVHDHHVPGLQGRAQNLLDERREHVRVHGPIDHRRATHPIHAQRPDQRGGHPVSVRHFIDQTFTPKAATTQPRHVGLCPGLIDEDQPTRVDARPPENPLGAACRDVRTVLLRRVDRLFL